MERSAIREAQSYAIPVFRYGAYGLLTAPQDHIGKKLIHPFAALLGEQPKRSWKQGKCQMQGLTPIFWSAKASAFAKKAKAFLLQ